MPGDPERGDRGQAVLWSGCGPDLAVLFLCPCLLATPTLSSGPISSSSRAHPHNPAALHYGTQAMWWTWGLTRGGGGLCEQCRCLQLELPFCIVPCPHCPSGVWALLQGEGYPGKGAIHAAGGTACWPKTALTGPPSPPSVLPAQEAQDQVKGRLRPGPALHQGHQHGPPWRLNSPWWPICPACPSPSTAVLSLHPLPPSPCLSVPLFTLSLCPSPCHPCPSLCLSLTPHPVSLSLPSLCVFLLSLP